jgi:uridine kinase
MAEKSVEYLNELAKAHPERLVAYSEDEYHRRIFDIASYVNANDKIHVILLAGPSGSGKTTTASLISDAIEARGREAFVISLDNFYRNSDDCRYPRLSDGSLDLESPEALNIDDVHKTLIDIVSGAGFSLPRYDFKAGRRVENAEHPPMPKGVVIIEGLHALNPKIFSSLPSENMYKIFISVSTNINENGKRILSGRKIRFARRLVRDSIYRGADTEKTLEMWQGVLAGEDKYLYPYRNMANVSFDTFHEFELSVMKPFLMPLLPKELVEKNALISTVYNAFEKIHSMDDSYVPESSLIREFIPGGKYEQLY